MNIAALNLKGTVEIVSRSLQSCWEAIYRHHAKGCSLLDFLTNTRVWLQCQIAKKPEQWNKKIKKKNKQRRDCYLAIQTIDSENQQLEERNSHLLKRILHKKREKQSENYEGVAKKSENYEDEEQSEDGHFIAASLKP